MNESAIQTKRAATSDKQPVHSFKDLAVYQKLFELHIEVNDLTLTFPKFEMFELGSQLRRSSNSVPADIAEGWNNKHINIYLEGINRAMGEMRETSHHLTVALRKGYLPPERYEDLMQRYEECARMLRGLEQSLERYSDRR